MTLSQALRCTSYPGAVLCLQTCYPYSNIRKRTLVHVCRQGGVYRERDGAYVPYWWTVSTDAIELRDELYYAWHTQGRGEVASFHSLSGCYQWLKTRHIDAHSGWYPSGNPEGWFNLGGGYDWSTR